MPHGPTQAPKPMPNESHEQRSPLFDCDLLSLQNQTTFAYWVVSNKNIQSNNLILFSLHIIIIIIIIHKLQTLLL
jgi:hypothetical protein